MSTWIVLLRGINVGGNNLLPMADLRSALEERECEDVQTYIQSGNVVLRSALRSAGQLQQQVADAIEETRGFRVPVLALKAKELDAALEANPFPHAQDEKALHLFFLFAKPRKPDLEGIAAVAKDSEEFELLGRTFYLHAPEGIARSKAAAQVEKHLGVEGTGRNLRTARKLQDMAR